MTKANHTMLSILIRSFAACLLFAIPTANGKDLVKFWVGGPGRDAYDAQLLAMALDETIEEYGEYQLELVDDVQGVNRGRRLLGKGIVVNIYVSASRPDNQNMYTHLLEVEFPILQGLLGYRRLAILKSRQNDFSSVNSVAGLSRFVAGQGRGWLDVAILQHNGIQVNASGEYKNLFEMLDRGRFDYLLLGAHEIVQAVEAQKDLHPNIVIDRDLLLYYPFPVVYQVSPTYPELAKRVMKGLKKLEANGRFDQFFRQQFATVISELQQHKKLILLRNPYVAKTSPLARPHLLLNSSPARPAPFATHHRTGTLAE